MTDALKPADLAVLITRPQPQAGRLAAGLRLGVDMVISPLMQTEFPLVALPNGPFSAVIVTSEAGAKAAGALRRDLPDLVHCVGQRTAEAARQAGFRIGEVAQTAETLLPRLLALPVSGKMIYLHGRDVSVPIDKMLAREGAAAVGLVVYAQVCVPLEEAALQLLKAKKAILVPFYSARSARLFLAACPQAALAKIWPCVIAEPVADALPKALKARTMVADAPTGAAMMTAIQRAVASMLP